MRFEHPYFLAFLLLLAPMIWVAIKQSNGVLKHFSKEILEKISPNKSTLSPKIRALLLSFAFAFGVVAIARPAIDMGEIKIKSSSKSLVVAIDISKSMFVKDLYPNRFEFAKAKFKELLKHLKQTKVALLGFSDRAFLIAPLTNDYNSLRFLSSNLKTDYLNLKGTSILEALKSANDLMKDKKSKALLIFSDGGDKKDYSKEISYAKEHNIKVFIYATATKKGKPLKENGEFIKDKKGDIVIFKRDDKIKELALKTGGAYMVYSLNNQDMAKLANIIENSLTIDSKEEQTIHNKKELFIYPLGIAILLIFMALFSLPTRRKNV